MRIVFKKINHLELRDYESNSLAEMIYTGAELKLGKIISGTEVWIEQAGIGIWHTFTNRKGGKKIIAEIKLRTAGIICINYIVKRKKYRFKTTGIFKSRFTLYNGKGDELLALLPVINWNKLGHEFSVQINDEYHDECSSLLILHTVHCANCCLGIINGIVPAQVSTY